MFDEIHAECNRKNDIYVHLYIYIIVVYARARKYTIFQETLTLNNVLLSYLRMQT